MSMLIAVSIVRCWHRLLVGASPDSCCLLWFSYNSTVISVFLAYLCAVFVHVVYCAFSPSAHIFAPQSFYTEISHNNKESVFLVCGNSASKPKLLHHKAFGLPLRHNAFTETTCYTVVLASKDSDQPIFTQQSVYTNMYVSTQICMYITKI